MDHPRGTPRSLFCCLPFLLVRSTDLPWISAEVSIFRPPDDKPSHIMSLEVMSYCCIKCLVFLSSLGTDNSPTYPLDGDPHLLLRQVHRCNIFVANPGYQFVRAVSWAGREGDDRPCGCAENHTVANSALPVDHRRSRPVGFLRGESLC